MIADFEKWISLGAPDPRDRDAADANEDASAACRPAQPLGVSTAAATDRRPKSRIEASAQSEIDRFVLAKLEAAGVTPSPQASPRALLRRLSYDLTGLPPTADELAAFAADPSDARYEAAVDRLLASPRFGERWARYWLDVARYADTKGYVFEEDRNYPHAYKYRDWVIASFNDDLPYDEFVVAQLAADQLDDPACAPAMGFLTLGRRFLNNQHDIIDDRIDVITRGLMGLTVACARCHDHKYDPIRRPTTTRCTACSPAPKRKPRDDAPPMLDDADEPVEPVVFLRGSPGNRGPKVDRHFLSCLAPTASRSRSSTAAAGSNWPRRSPAATIRSRPACGSIASGATCSATALVATPSDFGTRGTPPTHPELLDWLACDLHGRRLVDQAADPPHRAVQHVSAGERRARRVRRRSIPRICCCGGRIAAGSISKRFATACSWRPAGSTRRWAGRRSSSPTSPFPTRRAVYGFIERQNLPAFFRTFDFANPNTHTPERPQTASPQQALFLLNSPFVLEQATHLAARSANAIGGERPQMHDSA